MSPQVTNGYVIFRVWDSSQGLSETRQRFDSLDDLFALCLQIEDPRLVDRVVFEGHDGRGHPRLVTFSFQSLALLDQDPADR